MISLFFIILPNYILDNKRSEIHYQLKEYYHFLWGPDFNEDRFNEICHNLDKVIGFNPPLQIYDSIKPYARKINLSMSIGYMRHYITNRVDEFPTIST